MRTVLGDTGKVRDLQGDPQRQLSCCRWVKEAKAAFLSCVEKTPKSGRQRKQGPAAQRGVGPRWGEDDPSPAGLAIPPGTTARTTTRDLFARVSSDVLHRARDRGQLRAPHENPLPPPQGRF